MTANLTTAPSALLLRLLQVFDAESLGEGDMATGANVIAAKCIALANSYPPGACLVSDDGSRLTVGMSFASIGGLTNFLIADRVIAPLASLQNNLVDHIAADATHSDTVRRHRLKMPLAWPNWIWRSTASRLRVTALYSGFFLLLTVIKAPASSRLPRRCF